jgi:hypothetical protein
MTNHDVSMSLGLWCAGVELGVVDGEVKVK